MKKIIAAFAILACLASAPSYADSYSAGVLGDTPTGHEVWSKNIFYSGGTSFAGSFSDVIDFSIAGRSELLGAVAEFDFSAFPIDTTINSYSLYQGLYGDSTSDTLKISGTNPTSFTLASASPGYYYLLISGSFTGALGGYAPSLSVAPVAAVPEPETWLMLGIGAALVGFQLRRKANAMESLSIAV